MPQALPHFRFHPDPIQSGAIEPSDATCGVCGQARGYVYAGPCYVEDDFDAELCPWCIADGSAHQKFGITFHELEPGPHIDDECADEIEERTPGLTSWNPMPWPTCCGAPMAYLEPVGRDEIRQRHPNLQVLLIPQLMAELGLARPEAQRLFDSLQRDQSPCAHVFRCDTCRTPHAHVDFD